MNQHDPVKDDAIDLIIVVAWAYVFGFVFAWLIPRFGWNPFSVASIFGLIALIVGIWGIERRRRTGRFPVLVSLLVFALPFNCALLGIAWQALMLLGLIE